MQKNRPAPTDTPHTSRKSNRIAEPRRRGRSRERPSRAGSTRLQPDFVPDLPRLDVRGPDGHNPSVVRLTKKSAAGEAGGACSGQERILPDTFSTPNLANEPPLPWSGSATVDWHARTGPAPCGSNLFPVSALDFTAELLQWGFQCVDLIRSEGRSGVPIESA